MEEIKMSGLLESCEAINLGLGCRLSLMVDGEEYVRLNTAYHESNLLCRQIVRRLYETLTVNGRIKYIIGDCDKYKSYSVIKRKIAECKEKEIEKLSYDTLIRNLEFAIILGKKLSVLQKNGDHVLFTYEFDEYKIDKKQKYFIINNYDNAFVCRNIYNNMEFKKIDSKYIIELSNDDTDTITFEIS